MKKIVLLLLLSILMCNGVYAAALNFQIPHSTFSNPDNQDMIIIAPTIFEKNIQPLITHKNSVGVLTFFKSTKEIYMGYNGFDEAEKIKYFIKDAIKNFNISYVLFMGGKIWQLNRWNVPVRYSFIDDGFDYSYCISDLCFADIYDAE